jgi:7,8-dihydropterin-6-yl-methyl-4-(beta-D-ribofuranosyl)aminobenzene 5'-phosphate synthase
MQDHIEIREVDKVEILTLQDNYIDITATDSNEMISRAMITKEGEIRNSVIAEHGYSAIVRTSVNGQTRALLFDSGFSEFGAAYNAKSLEVNMGQVETVVLSHGHSDHLGGLERLVEMIGKKNLEFIVHPSVFKEQRYLKIKEDLNIYFPQFTKGMAEKIGLKVIESNAPRLLLDGSTLFLGEIPKRNDFERGLPNAYFQQYGEEKKDVIEDDTSLVMNLKGKGLIVLSGCAHSGIINTVSYAKELTGVDNIHVIMGGFHLGSAIFEPVIGRTTVELQKINPTYLIPTHCTGRKAAMHMEREMPEQFILNMSGTKLTFAA